MSFVPAPQQANAASANKNALVSSSQAPAAAADADAQDKDHVFKMRTFDVFWVEKSALMYKDGIAKVSFPSIFLDLVLRSLTIESLVSRNVIQFNLTLFFSVL